MINWSSLTYVSHLGNTHYLPRVALGAGARTRG